MSEAADEANALNTSDLLRLIDARFEVVTADRVSVRVSGAFVLELPRERSQVSSGEQVVAVETCRDMLRGVLARIRLNHRVVGFRQ